MLSISFHCYHLYLVIRGKFWQIGTTYKKYFIRKYCKTNSPYGKYHQVTSNCDSSYPDNCISSPPPNLNCKDVSVNDFEVLPPDPHGFDRDEDGIGCES
jgi:hypothetical protein